jgi:hypothetical protein
MASIEKETTFAFSKRRDAWTTRYSFTPTCYATCGDILMSSKDTSGNSGGVWRHDTNNQRNSFYGALHETSMTLSSNDDPSAVKIFKSISLETNTPGWSAKFYSNSEYAEDNNSQETEFFSAFKDKEGFKYMEVPRSIKNSTSHIVPCPLMSMSGEGIPNYNQYMVDVAVPSEVAVPQGKLLNSSLQSFSEVEGGFNDIYITSYYEDNQVALDISSNEGADEEDLLQAIDGFLSDEQMFSESSVAHNGDQMRGPYLKVDLEVTTPRQIELHAINVDYEFSKLDKRLTQNT